MARCLLIESGLPDSFWAEAVQTANYIRKRCSSESLKTNVKPYEVWHNEKPNVSNLRRFGCKAFVLNKAQTLNKLAPRSEKCIFVGYAKNAKAYRLWDVIFMDSEKHSDAIVDLNENLYLEIVPPKQDTPTALQTKKVKVLKTRAVQIKITMQS